MECSICLDDAVSDIVTTVCRHTFHTKCLNLWRRGTCPYCRHPLLTQEEARRQRYEQFVRAQFPDSVTVNFAYDMHQAAHWNITTHGVRHWMSREWCSFYRRAPEVTQRAYRLSNQGGAPTRIVNCVRGAPPTDLAYCRYGNCLVTNDPVLLDSHMRYHAIEEQLDTFLSLML